MKTIFLVAIMIGSFEGFSQNKQLKKNDDCVNKQNKSFGQRIKNYPFPEAAYIELVSFLNKDDSADRQHPNRFEQLPMKVDSIVYGQLREKKKLTLADIDALTGLFYNVGYRGTVEYIQDPRCYAPRNAILFYNAQGEVFEYIEICFECNESRVTSDKIKLGDICSSKFDLIRKFFKNKGIFHGTKD